MSINSIFAAAAALMFMLSAASANELKMPTGPVVLSVSGKIAHTNHNERAVFDMSMLDELPQTEFETTTIWTQGKHRFSGVSLKHFLEAVGAKDGEIQAIAINDYAVTIPFADAVSGGPIIATKLNGQTMSVRDKGPLWIVYPYDSKPAFRSETIYARSIWQLGSIKISQ